MGRHWRSGLFAPPLPHPVSRCPIVGLSRARLRTWGSPFLLLLSCQCLITGPDLSAQPHSCSCRRYCSSSSSSCEPVPDRGAFASPPPIAGLPLPPPAQEDVSLQILTPPPCIAPFSSLQEVQEFIGRKK